MAKAITYISQKQNGTTGFDEQFPIGTYARYVQCTKENQPITLEDYLKFILNKLNESSGGGGSGDIEWEEVY